MSNLVLSRRIGEILCIGDNIEIKIREISGSQVKMCISAPPDIAVDRKEIRKRKDAEKIDSGY